MNTQQFPEIAKAVGAQRGGKYLKRIPKPGGGYRYVYKEEAGKKPGRGELIRDAKKANNAGLESLNRAAQSMKSDNEDAFYEAAGHIEVANKQWQKLSAMVGKARAGQQRREIAKNADVLGAKIERVEAKLEVM